MRLQEYVDYLASKGNEVEVIDRRLGLINEYVEFLAELQPRIDLASAGKRELAQFARNLIAKKLNTVENFDGLTDYADWLGHRQMYIDLVELKDCHNALAVLAEQIDGRHGRELRKWIFDEPLPPLGTDEGSRRIYTRRITQRMAAKLSPAEVREAWFRVQHGIQPEAWREGDLADAAKFEQCGSIDSFLAYKRKKRDEMLTRLHDEGRLWYTIQITDEVLEFITNDPEMECGRREGDEIFITKVPYNAVRYLQSTDVQSKRYYACHCPMLREAIRNDEPVSPDVCYCSLGHASHYLAGLGTELSGEVLESAVRGDGRCRFVFHLPKSST